MSPSNHRAEPQTSVANAAPRRAHDADCHAGWAAAIEQLRPPRPHHGARLAALPLLRRIDPLLEVRHQRWLQRLAAARAERLAGGCLVA